MADAMVFAVYIPPQTRALESHMIRYRLILDHQCFDWHGPQPPQIQKQYQHLFLYGSLVESYHHKQILGRLSRIIRTSRHIFITTANRNHAIKLGNQQRFLLNGNDFCETNEYFHTSVPRDAIRNIIVLNTTPPASFTPFSAC